MRISLLLSVVFCSLSFAWVRASAAQTGFVSLQSLRDNARPLLIFAARPDDPQLEIQVRTLREHAAAVSERQLVEIAIPYQTPSPSDAHLTAAEAVAVRRRFNVAPGDFTVILLGKDGGEKLRSSKPLSFEKLQATIDAMPMRQDEMKRQ